MGAMYKTFYTLLFLIASSFAFSQVADRYPYIQSPDQASVIIAWNNATSGIGSVNWGTSSGSLTNTVSDFASTQLHALTISGLQPNTKYYYQAVCGSFQSNIEYFYTAKPDNVRQMDFVVYGDCGFNSSQQDSISAHMATTPQDFGLVVGDVDQITGNNYDVNYFSHYTGMTKNVCHFTAVGNHDTLTNQTNYINQFYLPHNNPANSELYYSFTWGHAKFIALDGNIDCSIGSAQYTWLESELKCNNSEWTFIYFHQPPWTNAWDISYVIPFQYWYQYEGNVDMRTSLVPLFEKYHVDAVLNGHAHDYQRGVYNGVHYFIAGGGGTSTPDTHRNSNAPNIQYEQDVNNFMHFSINGDSVHFYALGLTGAAIDSGSFTKTFAPYTATISAQSAGCGALNNGSALIQVSGPREPYTFSWSNSSTTALNNNLTAATYFVTITDTSGCISSDSVIVSTTDSIIHIQISAAPTGLTVQLSASQANAGTYTWVLGNGVVLADTTSSLTYTYADTGTYAVELITNENCGADTAYLAIDLNGQATNVLNVEGSNFGLTVFPNPFKNSTTLIVSSRVIRNYDVAIYNIEGQQMKTMHGITGNQLTIYNDGLAAGYYLLAVTIDHTTATLKLVVQ